MCLFYRVSSANSQRHEQKRVGLRTRRNTQKEGMKLIEVSCPVCGPACSEKVFDVLSQRLRERTPYQLRRCSQCGLVITSPRPDSKEMDRLYAEEYFPVGQASSVTGLGRFTIREQAN